ncbi:MAG: hypothetical protein NHB14_25515 [Desulfosporosinus sp.]|nr:hypothetical protein [Desulfosporosinus sp.]
MSRQDLSDFEIGYEYVRKRYSFLANHSSHDLWKLGIAYLQSRGPTPSFPEAWASISWS